MRKTVPAVSFIIPVYNMENYVGECLESIFAQTFKDYEVIVIDDCSTDNSVKIIESYQPKFGDKLKLIRSEKNSGGYVGVPRNKGIKMALGEYIFLVDADDAVIPTALEELYPIAKKFDADIVHCERFLIAPGETVSTDKSILSERTFEFGKSSEELVTEPTLYTNSLAERAKDFADHNIAWHPWSHIIRRSLLNEYNLKFPLLKITDDLVFCFYVVCYARNFVRVPNAVYNYRILSNSNSRGNYPPEKLIQRRGKDFFISVGLIDDFMNRFQVFRDQPELKYAMFDRLVADNIWNFPALYSQVPEGKLDGLIRKEISDIKDQTALTTFLFARMNIFNERINQCLEVMKRLSSHIKKQNPIVHNQQKQIEELQTMVIDLRKQLQNKR